MNRIWLALLLAGCALDPRLAVLRDETERLRTEVALQRMSEEEAHRRLDARTAELYGDDSRFCDRYYPTMASSSEKYTRFGRNVFPGCFIKPDLPMPLSGMRIRR